jgi:hypothetical protein
MNVDRSSQDIHHPTISGEFGQNYRFLSELIGCREKNTEAAQGLEELAAKQLRVIRGKLNKRQIKILNDFLREAGSESDESLDPPVPEELEAAIRVRKRSTWLPWEAEAIRKIERWRSDLHAIVEHWSQVPPVRASRTSGAVCSLGRAAEE